MAKKSDIIMTLNVLSTSYPWAFAKDDEGKIKEVLVWYNALQHVPTKALELGRDRMIQTVERPSIAALWRCILDASNAIPSLHDVRQAIQTNVETAGRMEHGRMSKHRLVKRVWDAMGGYADIVGMKSDPFDYRIRQEYDTGREWFAAQVMKPEGAAMLTMNDESALLTEG